MYMPHNAPSLKHLECNNPNPICLNIPQNNEEWSCGKSDRPYSPINALNYLLKYKELDNNNYDNYVNIKDESKIPPGESCYNFERAWLAIIRDIHKRINTFTNLPTTMQEEIKNTATIPNEKIDIMKTFTDIITIAETNWNTNCGEYCDITSKYISKYKKLLANEGFILFCSKFSNLTPTTIKNIDMTGASPAEIKKVGDSIKDLFDLTLPFMSEVRDLQNSQQDFDDKMENVINYFKINKKGGKKTRKRKTRIKKRTKMLRNKRRTRKIIQRGGDFGATIGICIVIGLICIFVWMWKQR